MEPAKMYLRIKREKRILFFECYSSDIVEVIKKKLNYFYKQEPNEMRLFYGTRVRLLDDKATFQDQTIQNDSELQLKLKKQSLEWEE